MKRGRSDFFYFYNITAGENMCVGRTCVLGVVQGEVRD